MLKYAPQVNALKTVKQFTVLIKTVQFGARPFRDAINIDEHNHPTRAIMYELLYSKMGLAHTIYCEQRVRNKDQ